MSARWSGSTRHAALTAHLVGREFRIRYRRSVLGWLWAVVQPFSRFLILWFVFTRAIPLDVRNYPSYLFVGILGWTWFSSSVVAATTSVEESKDLLERPGLPSFVVPLTRVVSGLVDYMTALPVALVFVLVSGGGLPASAPLLVLPLALQFAMILGLAYLLAPVQVHFRDVVRVLDLAMILGFYLTPVFYTPDALPAQYRWIVDLNPMAHLLEIQRDVLVAGSLPDLDSLAYVTAMTAITLAAGVAIFRARRLSFLDEL